MNIIKIYFILLFDNARFVASDPSTSHFLFGGVRIGETREQITLTADISHITHHQCLGVVHWILLTFSVHSFAIICSSPDA